MWKSSARISRIELCFLLTLALAGCAERQEKATPSRQAATIVVSAPKPKIPKPPPGPSNLEIAALESEKGERAYRNEYYKIAERHFRAAMKLAPGELHPMSGLAWTHYDSGKWDKAFLLFQKAYKRHPKDAGLRRGLGYLYYRYGWALEAKKMLGSLDKEKWPELSNVDDELNKRKLAGLPTPELPSEDNVSDRLFGFLKPKPSKKKERVPDSLLEVLRAVPPKKKKKTPEPKRKKLVPPPAKAEAYAQKPSSQDMAKIPGGKFVLAPSGRVGSFRLDRLEVTNALYAAYVKEMRVPEPPFWRWARFSGPHLPVVGVTWHEARAYCGWAGKRLPTEDEWEFAAQGGEKRRRYPWGKKFRSRHAVFGLRPDRGAPRAVGRHPGGASFHGVEELAGNVWEWVESKYGLNRRNLKTVKLNGVAYRALRGGSWVNSRSALASDSRTGDLPGSRRPVYGFRCAADSP